MALSLKIQGHSEIGLVRSNNQDSAYISPSLIVVADGMGGAAAGDLASSVAIRELSRADAQNRPSPEHPDATRLAGEQLTEVLGGALTKANDTLADLVAWDHSLEGMGTTVCGAMFSGSQYGICHIGDSRGYLVRDGEFRRLTHDHSWVQSLVDDGKISLEEAATHPHRSLLLKVLNGQPTHTPDFQLLDAKLGDRLLFCSDGLCGLVEDDVIEAALTDGDDLAAIVAELTKAAHAGGGLDNITIVVADVVEHDPALEALAPQVLGAAATVEIPKLDTPAPIDLGDGREDTHRLPLGLVPQAPAPAVRPGAEPPPGVIDPDRFEQIRYTPQVASARRRLVPVLSSIVVVLALLVGAFIGIRGYLAGQFHLGPDDGRVAVYQGIPEDVLGRELSSRLETSTIRLDDLPPYYAGQVRDRGLRYDSLDLAHEGLANLGRMAEKCIAERAASASPPPSTPAPAPTSTDDPQPAETSPAIGDSPTAAPSATETAAPATSASLSPNSSRPVPASSATTSPSSSGRPDLEACG